MFHFIFCIIFYEYQLNVINITFLFLAAAFIEKKIDKYCNTSADLYY